MTKKDKARKMKVSATYGKNGLPELPAVPCLIIVVGPPMFAEPGEQPQEMRGPCNCYMCRYRMKHTGHA